MRSAAARGIWCSTCGTYIRPGTHGIHAIVYGDGEKRTPAAGAGGRQAISDAHAVALVVMLVAGLGFAAFLVILWLARAAQ